MGLENRTYWSDSDEQPRTSGLSFGFPPLGRVVKYLLLINVAVFVLQAFQDKPSGGHVGAISAALGANLADWWQVWRYVTFQFLHASFWHIGMNMLGLYLLGSPLEQHWGPRRFLAFYLSCGAFAGMAYVGVTAAVGGQDVHTPIIGASGGIFAILLACAVLFPNFKLFLIVFPVPIRLAATLIFLTMILVVWGTFNQKSHGPEFWSQSCHLGGAVAAAFYVWVLPKLGEAGLRLRASGKKVKGSGAWKRRMDKLAAEQAEIDRILQKIHDRGLASLSHKEQKTLRDATKRHQAEEREAYRP